MKHFCADNCTSELVNRIIGGARRATKFIAPDYVIAANARHKPDKRSKRIEILLKLGAPNFRERAFIKTCQKAGEPFPVKKVQLKFFK